MNILSVFIRQRNSKYYVMVEYRDNDNRRKQKSLGSFNSSREANKLLIKEKNKLLNNDLIIPNKLTVESFLREWHSDRYNKLSITTYNRYELIINEIIQFMGNTELQKVTPLLINKFYNSLSRLSEKTKLQYHRLLSKAFKDAYRLQYINKNIMELVEAPKPKKFTANFLDPVQVKQLFDGVKGSRYEVPVNLAIGLGLRLSEICGLEWSKVDFDNNIITIDKVSVWDEKNKIAVFKEPKSESSQRVLTAPTELMQLLKEHKEKQKQMGYDTNLVFTNENGTQASSASFHTPYRNYIKRRKLPDVRFHDLRHTNASLMLLAGVDAKTTSKRLGHSEIGITMNLYTHVMEQLERDASNRIENLIYKK